MSVPAELSTRSARTLRRVRLRVVLILLGLTVLPIASGVGLLLKYATPSAAAGAALLAIGAFIVLSLRTACRYDLIWLARALDRQCPTLEDSSALVLQAPSVALNPLAQLQKARIAERLCTLAWPELRPQFPMRALLLNNWVAATVLAVTCWWPLNGQSPSTDTAADAKQPASTLSASAGQRRPAASALLLDADVRIVPPKYTGLPEQVIKAQPNSEKGSSQTNESGGMQLPDIKAPSGSTLHWDFRLAQASAVALRFDDGSEVALKADGGDWQAEQTLTRSALYRLRIDGHDVSAAGLRRLDAIPDLAPQVTVEQPEKTLNERSSEQKTWALVFNAQDDYGLANAELTISKTEGSGENISVKSQTIPLQGTGDARHRHYQYTVQLDELKLQPGDDLIVRLAVRDNREPEPNVARSAGLILRSPAEAAKEGSGVEGIVRGAQPAYFRSERQLIIDTEALLHDRDTLDTDHFASRSDELGVDQKLLRLRYGEFLGEEFEGNAEHAPPGAKVPEAVANATDEHAAAGAPKGDAGQVEAEFGHMHDKPEAATLLDPETKRLLRAAIDAMWQAEGQLRLAKPDEALPYEHQALEAIKQVQQASRIYLARSGLQLPEIDATRRLSGKREGLTDRSAPANEHSADDAPVRALWQVLGGGTSNDVDLTPQLDALDVWTREHAARLPDALGVQAARARAREPGCAAACRAALRASLWPLLSVPAAAVQPRTQPSARDADYLNAMGKLAAPAGAKP